MRVLHGTCENDCGLTKLMCYLYANECDLWVQNACQILAIDNVLSIIVNFCGWLISISIEERNGEARRKNPKRVGANFHQNLKRLGLWDQDDDDWLVIINSGWIMNELYVWAEGNVLLECTAWINDLDTYIHTHMVDWADYFY